MSKIDALTVQFPSIGVRASFDFAPKIVDGYYNPGQILNLGCHCATLSHIYLTLKNKSIEALDGAKIARDMDGRVSYSVVRRVYREMEKVKVSDEDRDRMFGKLADLFVKKNTQRPEGYTFVLMSDNVNSYSKAFPKASGIDKPEVLPYFKTFDFIQWLRKNKVGVLMGSPISRNHFHQSSQNFSLVQAYVWIPPQFARYTCPDSWFVSGDEQIPAYGPWENKITKACGHAGEELWRDGIPLVKAG